MTHEQRKFLLAMAIIQDYSKTHIGAVHNACLQRTLNAFYENEGITPPQKIAAILTGKHEQENITLPEILLSPGAVPELWDNIEIEPINEDKDENEGICTPVTDDETEINFYSVYLHDIHGGVSCIADCTSEAQAQVLADLIAQAAKNYKDNGFLNDSKI